ncbi:MAG: hypothetical protein FJZ96_03060 [Chloroflexi bacterium]|nr:hypothetical protein [Chloroflexota bacterium]
METYQTNITSAKRFKPAIAIVLAICLLAGFPACGNLSSSGSPSAGLTGTAEMETVIAEQAAMTLAALPTDTQSPTATESPIPTVTETPSPTPTETSTPTLTPVPRFALTILFQVAQNCLLIEITGGGLYIRGPCINYGLYGPKIIYLPMGTYHFTLESDRPNTYIEITKTFKYMIDRNQTWTITDLETFTP